MQTSKFAFDPEIIIRDICQHHGIPPIRLLVGLFDALAPYHRFGSKGAGGKLAGARYQQSVHDQIVAHCEDADPPRDHDADPPSSLLECLELAADRARRDNAAYAERFLQTAAKLTPHGDDLDDTESERECRQEADLYKREGTKHQRYCEAQRALSIVLGQCMNQLEREGLEFAIESEEDIRANPPGDGGGDGGW